ncbi:Gfo/Idh/MocA family protein [Salisaeta longa]|uniref:Gfo/Idh/MocA family protein n=1 Tax=Salisaeta longa TaxID=503170 RepID=UPI0003B40E3E|nr:Gfo/Idh/MocA family oxidoreductase [Salisaeta longa]
MDTIRWGILGTGRIASDVTHDLKRLSAADVVAVGSRKAATADAFADRFDIPHRHASYAALVEDPAVDVVHIATPHVFHATHAMRAIEAGKAVLCEKPLALNASEADRLIASARAHNVFLMEALWTRFLPVMHRVRTLLSDGAVGAVQAMQATIGAPTPFDPRHRLYDPALGGGALLDLGIYPIALAFDVLGPPDAHTSTAALAPTGVDAQCGAVFSYNSGAQAVWHASLRADLGRTCSIAGPDGRLEGTRAWWKGAPFTWTRADGTTQRIAAPFEGNGYQFEARHVMRCLREGRTESPVLPLDESRAMAAVMDALRAGWGVEYPQEA